MRDKKLMQVYESLLNDWYPRNEQKEEECPEGEQWCPIQKKCIPIGSGMKEAKSIGDNWKPIAQAFSNVYDWFDRLKALGAFGDKKYGKRLRKIESDLMSLTNDLDKEFGPGGDEIF